MGQTQYTNRFAIDPKTAATFGTEQLRENFLLPPLFVNDTVQLHYTNYDRMIVGGAVPVSGSLELETIKPTGTKSFLERRELIVVNIGGKGTVTVDGTGFETGTRDMVYAGMGSNVSFASASSETPAKFYLLSAPAHAAYPAKHIGINDAKRVDLGLQATSNERSIFQFIHPEGVKTCQLVVGMTSLAPGSVWNTMPCHIHDRRMEAYLYFDLPETARVFHFLGEPNETRHLVMKNEEAALSPGWSIHSGAGTANYSFIWAMAGDNVDYTDVDLVSMDDLK
ncbi:MULTISPECIES: 5-dehydro-4-deoxy-D-glucuronate isomerase [Agrobacterium]|uniref:4-deoxy-L-threo-5-hexosulose-uronate ketol-isomerase n=1 Tax=Agrobacterium rosae TaxID=1972867 RepID=A0A1R3THE1_9HYPH|nr:MULTISPECIES: 5-dehydro-4-deoxy-D-glucuronate isomerase [Agrobacterium]SCX11914.1 4-deoxy-L-threo-5-hexosulose-uronate ketol-isomerase 1 [Agrobacterium rosae]SCX19886.1 4-deoxy-L-threo-5-hexosulose-uronate ketol-isomerase 1 [Agrobacterium sp. DSM 25558]